MLFEVPSTLFRAYSKRGESTIFDEDIYVKNLKLECANSEIKESIRYSIKCYNNELYEPSVVMLGKAVEGAWIELGLSLFSWDKKNVLKNAKEIEKMKSYDSIHSKMNKVIKKYEDKTTCDELYKKSEINIKMLKNRMEWSNIVRESRNAIHFGVEPVVKNTYEKVSILLLAATEHFQIIYKIIETCKNDENPN